MARMDYQNGLVLGVDVGWSEKKMTTAACVLEWTPTEMKLSPTGLQTSDGDRLKHHLAARPIMALAIDGPLRGGLDEIGSYRDAELILTRGFAERIGKPGQSNSGNGRKLNGAANSVARALLATGTLAPAVHAAKIHERAIVEAFPTSFMGVMLDEGCIPAHGRRSDAYFLHLLGPSALCPPRPATDRLIGLFERLLPGRRLVSGDLAVIEDHEERAAVVCAITALCVVARKYVAVGDPQNGYIVLPPRAHRGEPGLQPWDWSMIDGNRPANATAPVVVEQEVTDR
jgi:predicted RNase H-like nuclease